MPNEIQFQDIGQYDQERQQLARRRKLADKLLGTQLNTGVPADRMVSGRYVAPGMGEMMNAFVSPEIGRIESDRIDVREKDLAAREAQQANELLSSIPQSGPERQQALFNAGNQMPSLRNSISALLAADERKAIAEQNNIDRRADLAIRLGADAERDAKYRRSFDEAMALKQAPTSHITIQTGGGVGPGFKVPSGYMLNPEGNGVVPIPGMPAKPTAAEKPLNENQGNALIYGTRAAQAHNILESVGASYSPMKIDMARGAENVPGGRQAANTFLLSGQEQMVDQAQRNFINAIMRRESGAVISPEEFNNARKQYFPEQGDQPAVLAQKKANREIVIKGLGQVSGPQGQRAIAAEQANTPAAAQKPTVAPGTRGIHKGKPVVMGQDGEWRYEN